MALDLFSDVPIGHAEHAAHLVESALAQRGLDPTLARQPDGPKGERRYALERGSALTLIQVSSPGLSLSAPAHGRIRMAAPVVTWPAEEQRAALYQHLLEENATLVGVAFALSPRAVILVAERTVLDLDESEVHAMIDTITAAADRYDDLLAARFGVERVADGAD